MTESATIFTRSTAPLAIALLVLPQTSILELASTLDPLRAANRQAGWRAFDWRVVSPDGRAVPLTCGIDLPAVGDITAATGADALFIVAGFRQDENATLPLLRRLRRLAPRFRALGGIDAGAWVLARAGLLDGCRATVHWEDLEDFAAAHPAVEVVPDRFVVSGRMVTAAGAGPALDLMLSLVRARLGATIAQQVAGAFITSPGAGDTPQTGAPLPAARRDPRLRAAIARLEARLDAPEPTAATARALGLSSRRLETLFAAEFGMGPGAYGREMRLQSARRMVTDTSHALRDIALRTGFASQSALSRSFRNRFGYCPSTLRRGR